jgi:hypothetical protein
MLQNKNGVGFWGGWGDLLFPLRYPCLLITVHKSQHSHVYTRPRKHNRQWLNLHLHTFSQVHSAKVVKQRHGYPHVTVDTSRTVIIAVNDHTCLMLGPCVLQGSVPKVTVAYSPHIYVVLMVMLLQVMCLQVMCLQVCSCKSQMCFQCSPWQSSLLVGSFANPRHSLSGTCATYGLQQFVHLL